MKREPSPFPNRVDARLSDADARGLYEAVVRHGTSVSDILRRALRHWLETERAP